MGLGGYMAARTQIDHYDSERDRELKETHEQPEKEEEETRTILREQGVPAAHVDTVLDGLKADREKWVDWMMKFELGLEKPNRNRVWSSALVISFSYAFGGIIPLLPYLFVPQVLLALYISVGVTLTSLFLFGMVKGHYTGVNVFLAALQSTVIGGLAAGAAFGIAYLVSTISTSPTDT